LYQLAATQTLIVADKLQLPLDGVLT